MIGSPRAPNSRARSLIAQDRPIRRLAEIRSEQGNESRLGWLVPLTSGIANGYRQQTGIAASSFRRRDTRQA